MNSDQWKSKRERRRTLAPCYALSVLAFLVWFPAPAPAQLTDAWCAPDSPFGNAAPDHNLVVNGHYDMSGDEDWHNVTVNSTGTLDTNGHRLRACGTLLNYGAITDTSSGGAGGAPVYGGAGGYGCVPHVYARDGVCGQSGQSGTCSGAGRGGNAGGGGGGGEGAWNTTAFCTDYCTAGGNGGLGGHGGRGGGCVTIYAYILENHGSIDADGQAGSNGQAGQNGVYREYTCWGFDRDQCSGGGGGGAGGDGGNGGTVEIHCGCVQSPGDIHAYGGAGGWRGAGGAQPSPCPLHHQAGAGQHWEHGGKGACGGGDGGESDIGVTCSNDAGFGSDGAPGDPGRVLLMSQGTDVEHYDLDLTIDPATHIIQGTNVMSISCVCAASTFTFRLDKQLDATPTVFVSDWPCGTWRPASYQWLSDDITVLVTLGDTYQGGERFCVRVDYAGQPRFLTTKPLGVGMKFEPHGNDNRPIVFTTVEPWYAYLWWPVKDDGDNWNCDKATVALSFTVPDWMVAVSNGVQGTPTLAPPWATYHWSETHPVAAYLVCVAATDYVRTQVDSAITDVYLYNWPESTPPDGWERVAEMIDLYSQYFGTYPFADEKYAVYQWPEGYGAMEHQTAVGEPVLNSYRDSRPPIRAAEWHTCHELAHQWWGDELTCATWNDIWLNEGFASWSETIWFENQFARFNRANKLAMLRMYVTRYHASPFLGRAVYVNDPASTEDIFDYYTQYKKGPRVLQMLRHLTDPEYNDGNTNVFFEALQRYRQTAGGCASTSDFKTAVEWVCNAETLLDLWDDYTLDPLPAQSCDLSWFFNEWIYNGGAPALRYDWWQDAADHVHIRVKQMQGIYFGEPMFTMPLDVHTKPFLGDWTVHPLATWLQATDPSNGWVEHVVPIDPPHRIHKLELDRDEWVLTRWIADWTPGGLADLGRPGTTPETQIIRLKDESQAVGNARIGDHDRAFLWLAKPHYDLEAGVNDLGTLPGDTDAAAWAINHWGQIVGSSWSGNISRAFIWLPEADYGLAAGIHELETSAAVAWARAVNDAGQVAGETRSNPDEQNTSRAVLWQYDWEAAAWNVVELPVPDGFVASGTHDINNAGKVAGWLMDDDDEMHATMWEYDDTSATWPEPADLGRGEALAINDAGTVVGYSVSTGGQQTGGYWAQTRDDRAYYTWEEVVEQGQAYAINSYGQIVGEVNNKAFLYLPEPMYGLSEGVHVLDDDLIPSAACWTFTLGRDINDVGEIVGYGRPAGSAEPHAFLLDLDPLGDSNGNGILDTCDGDVDCKWPVNGLDIQCFVCLLIQPSQCPECCPEFANMDGDEDVDIDDLPLFVSRLLQGP